MKTLYLIRHAKSSWNENNVRDFDRKLSQRGKNDVKTMGKRLKKRGVIFDKILASSAKRTTQTARGLNKEFGLEPEQVEFQSSLYHSGVTVLLHEVCQTADKEDVLALVVHNPGVTDFCDYLSDVAIYFPTLGVAKITFECDSWREISKGTGTLEWFDFPKNDLI